MGHEDSAKTKPFLFTEAKAVNQIKKKKQQNKLIYPLLVMKDIFILAFENVKE